MARHVRFRNVVRADLGGGGTGHRWIPSIVAGGADRRGNRTCPPKFPKGVRKVGPEGCGSDRKDGSEGCGSLAIAVLLFGGQAMVPADAVPGFKALGLGASPACAQDDAVPNDCDPGFLIAACIFLRGMSEHLPGQVDLFAPVLLLLPPRGLPAREGALPGQGGSLAAHGGLHLAGLPPSLACPGTAREVCQKPRPSVEYARDSISPPEASS